VVEEIGRSVCGPEHHPPTVGGHRHHRAVGERPTRARGLHGFAFEGEAAGEVDHMLDPVDHSIGGNADDEAAERVTEQHVTRLDRLDDGVAIRGKGRVLVGLLAVPWELDWHCGMAASLELGDQQLPAPRAVEPAVDENEAHSPPLQGCAELPVGTRYPRVCIRLHKRQTTGRAMARSKAARSHAPIRSNASAAAGNMRFMKPCGCPT
jgi:hypothetical protein